MSVLVTVLIPCYNAESYVESAVRSIMNQTYKNLDIICIDDCSSDNTPIILQKLANEDKRIRIVRNNENLRLIKTLNKGIALANGEYIARMDSDDVSSSERIETQMKIFSNDPYSDVVAIVPNLIAANGRKIGKALEYDVSSNGSVKFINYFNSPITHPTVICKTVLLRQYYYRDIKEVHHVEDYDLWNRMLADQRNFRVLNGNLFYYRLNKGSVGLNNRKEQGQNHLYVEKIALKGIGYSIEERSIEIISKYAFPNSVKELNSATKHLNKFMEFYFRANSNLSQFEKKEIKEWVLQRCLFILFNALKKGPFPVKLIVFTKWLHYFKACFIGKTYINIVVRIKILLYKNV